MTDNIDIELEGFTEEDRIIAILRALGAVEEAAAALYRTYGKVWRKDAPFWEGLAKTEDLHRAHLAHLIVLVNGNADEFHLAQSFSVKMLEDVVKKTQLYIGMARSGHLNAKQALYHAHHLENMAVESELARLFKSDNPEFLQLSQAILADEKEHQDAISRLLRERYPRDTAAARDKNR